MHRPIMKIYNKIVMTVQNIAKLKQLEAQITNTVQEANERSAKINRLHWLGCGPKWSFVRTISEATKTVWINKAGKRLLRVRCIGLFRCRQTNEFQERTFYQHPHALTRS